MLGEFGKQRDEVVFQRASHDPHMKTQRETQHSESWGEGSACQHENWSSRKTPLSGGSQPPVALTPEESNTSGTHPHMDAHIFTELKIINPL